MMARSRTPFIFVTSAAFGTQPIRSGDHLPHIGADTQDPAPGGVRS
jgi:hypothetical protein